VQLPFPFHVTSNQNAFKYCDADKQLDAGFAFQRLPSHKQVSPSKTGYPRKQETSNGTEGNDLIVMGKTSRAKSTNSATLADMIVGSSSLPKLMPALLNEQSQKPLNAAITSPKSNQREPQSGQALPHISRSSSEISVRGKSDYKMKEVLMVAKEMILPTGYLRGVHFDVSSSQYKKFNPESEKLKSDLKNKHANPKLSNTSQNTFRDGQAVWLKHVPVKPLPEGLCVTALRSQESVSDAYQDLVFDSLE
jgi:hypothetical protein